MLLHSFLARCKQQSRGWKLSNILFQRWLFGALCCSGVAGLWWSIHKINATCTIAAKWKQQSLSCLLSILSGCAYRLGSFVCVQSKACHTVMLSLRLPAFSLLSPGMIPSFSWGPLEDISVMLCNFKMPTLFCKQYLQKKWVFLWYLGDLSSIWYTVYMFLT